MLRDGWWRLGCRAVWQARHVVHGGRGRPRRADQGVLRPRPTRRKISSSSSSIVHPLARLLVARSTSSFLDTVAGADIPVLLRGLSAGAVVARHPAAIAVHGYMIWIVEDVRVVEMYFACPFMVCSSGIG